jgi:hypothetical protein
VKIKDLQLIKRIPNNPKDKKAMNYLDFPCNSWLLNGEKVTDNAHSVYALSMV